MGGVGKHQDAIGVGNSGDGLVMTGRMLGSQLHFLQTPITVC